MRSIILIVDDSKEILEGLRFILNRDYDVHVASNGVDALEIVKNFKINLILTDFDMPEMDGPTLARKIRAKGVQTPIIFLSGGVTKELLKTAVRLEVNDVLEKPVNAAELRTSIKKTLQIHEAKINHQDKLVGLLQVTKESNRRKDEAS